MYFKITDQSDLAVVSLAEAKAQCRLTASFVMDDGYIQSLIYSSSALAQTFTNRMLTTGTVVQSWDTYSEWYYLWGGEVESITSLTATDQSGDVVDVPYTIDTVSQRLFIDSSASLYTNFTATFTAGYAVAPPEVKQGVLLMIASAYNNREDGLVGQTYQKLPMSSTVLLGGVRLFHES